MIVLFILLFVQCVIAGIVIFVLKGFLDRELKKAAIEKLVSLKAAQDINQITVYYAHVMPSMIQEEIKNIAHQKFSKGNIVFEQLQALKGGLMIKIADEVLDFSLSSRLEHLWS